MYTFQLYFGNPGGGGTVKEAAMIVVRLVNFRGVNFLEVQIFRGVGCSGRKANIFKGHLSA